VPKILRLVEKERQGILNLNDCKELISSCPVEQVVIRLAEREKARGKADRKEKNSDMLGIVMCSSSIAPTTLKKAAGERSPKKESKRKEEQKRKGGQKKRNKTSELTKEPTLGAWSTKAVVLF